MSWLEIAGFVIGVITIFLASKQNIVTFFLGLAYNGIFTVFLYLNHLYSSSALHAVYCLINIYGIFKWLGLFGLNGSKKVLTISRLSNEQIGGLVTLILIAGTIWGYCVFRLSGIYPDIFNTPRYPLLDACITFSCITAQFLLTHKKIETWYAWIIIDVVKIWIYFSIATYLTGVLHIIYIFIAINAIIEWRKEKI